VNNTIFSSPFGVQQDIIFMSVALEQAEIAAQQGEVPVGAVVIDEKGAIIARAYNQVEHKGTQRAHAEMLALEQAAASRGNWRLLGCWLYVTLEPCTMCMGLARLSRVAGVVYGARSPLMGYSLQDTLGGREDMVVIRGVQAEKAELVLKKFFKRRRT